MQKILSGSLQSLLSASCREDRPHAQDLSELLFKAKSDISLATTSHQSATGTAAGGASADNGSGDEGSSRVVVAPAAPDDEEDQVDAQVCTREQ